MKIYVVEGSTEEYSSHKEWQVKAFRSEDDAKAFIVKLSELIHEINIKGETKVKNPNFDSNRGNSWYYNDNNPITEFRYTPAWDEYLKTVEILKHDPNFNMDYRGTYYTYYEVELEE